MKLSQIIIYVTDVQATVEFYEKAFGLTLRFMHESNQYAELETGQTSLAFAGEKFVQQSHKFRLNRSEDLPAGAEIVFTVDDVDNEYARAVKSGATELAKPAEKPWGQTVSYVRDNNGFIVEICSAIH